MKPSSSTILQILLISLAYGRVVNHIPMHLLRDAGIDDPQKVPAAAPAFPLLPAPPVAPQLPAVSPPALPPAPPTPAPVPAPVSTNSLTQVPPPPAPAPAPVAPPPPPSVPGISNRPPGTIDPTLIPVGASLDSLPAGFVQWMIQASQLRPPGGSVNPANLMGPNAPSNPQLFPLLPAGVAPGTPGVPTANVPANPVDMLHSGVNAFANPTDNSNANPTPTNGSSPNQPTGTDGNPTPIAGSNNPQETGANGNTMIDGTDSSNNNSATSTGGNRNKNTTSETSSSAIRVNTNEKLVAGIILGALSLLI